MLEDVEDFHSVCAGRECVAVLVVCKQLTRFDSLTEAAVQNETGKSPVRGMNDALC